MSWRSDNRPGRLHACKVSFLLSNGHLAQGGQSTTRGSSVPFKLMTSLILTIDVPVLVMYDESAHVLRRPLGDWAEEMVGLVGGAVDVVESRSRLESGCGCFVDFGRPRTGPVVPR